ncbi:MAG: sulfur carrier protein ThiS adenylyltransferase ThiF [Bacteroidales bacterium]
MNDQHIRTKLKDKVVGIAGCGGLGSNCAVALARVGVGKLVITDYDKVDVSNLNRQYFFTDQVGKAKVIALKENINRIDPLIKVETHEIQLNEENIPDIFKECDVIVEAFDRAEMKQMIVETVLEKMPDHYLICGSGLAGWGENESIGMTVTGKLYFFGDGSNEVSEDFPPLAPRVGVVANMQANQVLEIILGKM